MTDRTGTEDERHQSQGSGVRPVASARRGVEHLLAGGVTAGFARAVWPELVLVADLRLPLATMEPERRTRVRWFAQDHDHRPAGA
jgi:hypothetical protein